jgi:arginyl-tRNA synthetase
LKFTRNSVIAFDFKEALSFEGETGPYCQYSAVRANSIFRKLEAREGIQTDSATGGGSSASAFAATNDQVNEILKGETGDEIWSLLMLSARLSEAISQAAASAEPAILAKYTFNLAKSFNLFYHRHRIIAEEDMTRRTVLIFVATYTRNQLTAALATLGISVPERM